MGVLSIIILIFSSLAALDYLFGSKLGIGKEFEKGFVLLGTMALSMIGMIVISPLLAELLSPVFDGIYNIFRIDPSFLPGLLFANDMGGAPLSEAVAKDPQMGYFNGLVVSSMMGATVSFTIPLSMKAVSKKNQTKLALGLLCGVVTIPLGCFVSGLICGIALIPLLLDLLPLLLLAILLTVGLLLAPELCVKIFKVVGFIIKLLVVMGLVLGIINFLAKEEVIKGLGTIEEGGMVCLNASIVMTGMFPLIFIVSKLLSKPLEMISKKTGMNSKSITGLVSTLATNVTTFGMMDEMDNKGIVLNSAFAVSGAFTLAGHLAFTMAFNEDYILSVTVGKLIAGITAVLLAFLLYGKFVKTIEKSENDIRAGQEF